MSNFTHVQRSFGLTLAFVLSPLGIPFPDLMAAEVDAVQELGVSRGDASPEFVAGRTLDQWTEQLGQSDRTTRLQAVRSLVVFGQPAGQRLTEALSDADAAVRYIAAVGLGDTGNPVLKSAVPTLGDLADNDSSSAVKMAAAYALCQAGDAENQLQVLIQQLDYPERGMVCSAAELLGKLGTVATPAVDKLRAVFEANKPGSKGDYHQGGAAKNALRKIGSID